MEDPSRPAAATLQDAWPSFGAEIGAVAPPPHRFWRMPRLQTRLRDWIVTIEHWYDGEGGHSVLMRAAFAAQRDLHFTICPESFASRVGKLFGMQDIEVGDTAFDAAFLIQGNNAEAVQRLFEDSTLRALLLGRPRVILRVSNDLWGSHVQFVPASHSQYPPGVDELWLWCAVDPRDGAVLRDLYELLIRVLDLVALPDSSRPELETLLRTVVGPAGQMLHQGLVVWDGDRARRRAAEELGRLGDSRAGEALLRALKGPDPGTRLAVVRALGEIGYRPAVPHLIPLLGTVEDGMEAPLRTAAATALGRLGEAALAEAFHLVLQGSQAALVTLQAGNRAPALLALFRALEDPDHARAAYAARGLAALGAAGEREHVGAPLHGSELLQDHMEARERVGARLRRARSAPPEVRELFQAALGNLKVSATLPRPAGTPAADPTSLPRPAGACPEQNADGC